MPDDLKGIVQRMIDAGESEANIGAVIQRLSSSTPVAADEPTTYAAGALKGAKEGIVGGAKGFAEGMLQSPASFAKGIVSMLTTDPRTTVKDAVAAIERLPDAIRSAGADPEAWGKGVGDVTGQTMIGMAGPRAVAAGARAVPAAARTVAAGAAMPAGAALGGLVGSAGGPIGTAAGAAVGGGLGRLAGDAIGAIQTPAEAAQAATSAAAQRLTAALSSGEPVPAAKFFELLRQVPPNERQAILAARQQAVATGGAVQPASPAPTAPAVAAPPAPAPAAPPAAAVPDPAPVPRGTPEPAPAPQTAPAPAQAAPQAYNPGVARQQVIEAFKAAGDTPKPVDIANATAMAKWKPAEQAVADIIAKRPAAAAPAVDPAAELLKRGFGVSDADVQAALQKKALSGTKSLMPKYGGDVGNTPVTGSAAVQKAPIAPKVVDGRVVRSDVPNMSSIESSLTDYEVLPGVREVKMSDFDPDYKPKPYSVSEDARLNKLTRDIAENKEISPLIVVVDKENYPYILEGGHRFDALRMLKAKSFPAVVVRDLESIGAK